MADVPDNADDAYKPVTRDEVADAGLMEGLFRQLNRQVKTTNDLIEHKVIPAQAAQTDEIHDLREQVTACNATVGGFDQRLIGFDQRFVTLEEVVQEYPKLVERVSALETTTSSHDKDIKVIKARPVLPTPVNVRGVYLALASIVTILASAGVALALR